jgi:hypothetical protein
LRVVVETCLSSRINEAKPANKGVAFGAMRGLTPIDAC